MSILLNKLSESRLEQLNKTLRWYHTINWPNGLQTAGAFNHNNSLAYYGFPESLAGKTVLDVGTSDGFFAFEFEKRGALSVTGIDILKYDGSLGFDPAPIYHESYKKKYSQDVEEAREFKDVLELLDIAGLNRFIINKDILQSQANFRQLSIYDLANTKQQYDFVFCGDLITHLKDPVGAAENLAAATKEMCIIALHSVITVPEKRSSFSENLLIRLGNLLGVNYLLSDPNHKAKYVAMDEGAAFFHFTPQAFKNLLLTAGFKSVDIFSQFNLQNQKHNIPNAHAIFHCYM